MAKLTPFALAAIALLGACTAPQSSPNIVTNVNTLRPGTGVVQAVMPTPGVTSATASSSAPLQRLEIKMSDGRLQYIDTPSREIVKGDRIQLSSDNVIRRL